MLRVRADVIDGYVTRAAAERDYGVIFTDELEIDWEATKRARQKPPSIMRGDVPLRQPPPKKRKGR